MNEPAQLILKIFHLVSQNKFGISRVRMYVPTLTCVHIHYFCVCVKILLYYKNIQELVKDTR